MAGWRAVAPGAIPLPTTLLNRSLSLNRCFILGQSNPGHGQVSSLWQERQVVALDSIREHKLIYLNSTGFTNNVVPAWGRGIQWAKETAGQADDKVDISIDI